MKILLTGSSGFLGKILKNNFVNDEVLELNRKNGNFQYALEKEIPCFNHFFDLIIHCAGKAHSVPKTEIDKQEFYNVNVIGTVNLLKGLENSGLPNRFVFISSVSVYGLSSGNNINEDYPLLAKDPYGSSKIEAEELVQKWCNDNKVICTILRLPLLVGKKPPGNLGSMVKAINKGYYFNIGGGAARKSMVLAKDVASFISIVAPLGGIYNLTDGVHPSFNTLSLAISKNQKEQFNLPLPIAKLIGKIGDFLGNKTPVNTQKIKKITLDLTFDDSKARTLLNWKPQSVLDYLENESLD
ncbi:NAD-dependent epimerase/dehydratase family protein [Flavobacterium sp. LS1R49]|uniref:NAD-dependent epimerase/dehydratase family protein n=1 Tax=Flavobacterium shii TaxID=2987687 RepID=A0A9X2ZDN2_9FLAO|nr:NAD-dependent epimerase/dehydratase family protein [Flavobacterium shii]MCV9927435.1 NAD-dependent epimerase/dehydratase family protein [Flavobacterium shii]